MANYCTYTQVATLLDKKNGFSDDTQPTSTQVEDIIDQTTNEIDTVLASLGITSQPTSTKLLATLEKYCCFGSAGHVGMTYFRNANDVTKSNAEWYYSKYEKFLAMLREDPEIFGIVADSESLYASNQVEDGTMSESEYNDLFLDDKEFKF